MMEYTSDFLEAVYVAKTENLFLGYGNPNGKILIIDMEQNYSSSEILDSEKYYEDLLKNRTEINQNNADSWLKNIGRDWAANWNLEDESKKIGHQTPFNYFSKQKNSRETGAEETSIEMNLLNACLQYQKIYENIFMDGKKQDYMNFEKEIFITYMNDLPSNKAFNYTNLNRLKQEFIDLRQEFFSLSFFRNFSVVILATDSYPHKYNFDIQKTFLSHWCACWQPEKHVNSWWHRYKYYRSEKSNFHTSAFNPPISDNLVESLSKEIKFFFENGYYEC